MQIPENAKNESKRQAALAALNILDTPDEARFDRITRAARARFQVSIALVSLVDKDRQWFKSRQALEATETPRDISFCAHAILDEAIFYIPNTLDDSRFADNPLVTGPPNIRFYAGAPLHAANGQRIGTLCIIDDKPRELSSDDLTELRKMANEVEKELLRFASRRKFTILQKLSLMSVFLVMLTAGVVGGLFYNKTTSLLAEHELISVSREIQHAGDMLNTIITTHDEDVLFLANTPPVQGILRARAEGGGYDSQGKTSAAAWVKQLQTIFSLQLKRKSTYLSIRFIDANGQELVMVSRQGQKIISASGAQLQNKINRSYVLKTLKLPAGSVYVSEMDLNREFGKVTEPRQEVIRSATPVYNDLDSSLAGLVSITADVGDKLRAIQTRIQHEGQNKIYITNDRGDYLIHPDANKTYGFEFGKHHRIQDDFPQLSDLFLPGNSEKQRTIRFQNTNDWQVMDFTKISFDANNPERFIAVVMTHDYSRILAEQSKLLNNVVFWSLLLSIVGAGSGILFAVNLTRPVNQITKAMDDYIHHRSVINSMPVNLNNEIGVMARNYQTLIEQVEEAHTRLKSMNTELEARVEERTNALELSESRQRSIVENIVDGLITINQNGIITSFNPAASKIFGYAADEVIGHNIKILMPEPYTSEHDSYLHNYLATGEKKVIGQSREVVGQRKDGSHFPMELAVSEMEVNGERIFTGIVRDISERKEAEQKFQEMNAVRQGILDSADFTIITTNTEGLIQTFNLGAERMLGYSADEVINKQSPAILHDMDEVVARAKELSVELGQKIEPGFEVFVANARKGESDEREWTYICKNGSRFPVLLSVTAIRDKENEIKGFLGIGLDITERKKVERMKSEFISTVSHELRTPLTSIRGALGLVLGKSAELLPEKIRAMLEMAERNSERLTLLINDILDLEKIESGRLNFEFKPVELVSLAQQAQIDNEGYAARHDVKLRFHSELAQAKILGDEHRLLQVFANLISNAVKYSPANGEVEILIIPVDKGYRVSVCDHGSGIPDEFRNRIFQRFAQADSSDTREKGGTGLGLSITKAIVEYHSGTIGYHSELNKGTEFYFELPEYRVSVEHTGNNARGIPVLICEDNPDVARILSEILKPEGVECDIASSGEAARKLLGENNYRLLLLDLTFPDLDGLQFLKELRETEATKDLPVIVVSGRAEEGRMAFNGDAFTVVDWIQKPIEQARLERALHAALHRIERPHILHVEDDPDIVQVTQVLLEGVADFTHVPSVEEARHLLDTHQYDLVILDLSLADGSGVELLDQLKSHCPVVIFSGENPSREISEQVTAALTKSTTTNEQLLATINKVLKG